MFRPKLKSFSFFSKVENNFVALIFLQNARHMKLGKLFLNYSNKDFRSTYQSEYLKQRHHVKPSCSSLLRHKWPDFLLAFDLSFSRYMFFHQKILSKTSKSTNKFLICWQLQWKYYQTAICKFPHVNEKLYDCQHWYRFLCFSPPSLILWNDLSFSDGKFIVAFGKCINFKIEMYIFVLVKAFCVSR